jgi:hypothetical protein
MKTTDIKSLTNKELTRMLRHYNDFTDEQVEAAYRELKSRGVAGEVLQKLRQEVRVGKLKVKVYETLHRDQRFNLSKPKVFRIGTTQQLVFEQRLISEGIPYHRREGLDVIVPLVNYYFADTDFHKADQIEVETENYVTALPPDKRSKATRRAGKAFVWIGLFFAFFLLFSLILKWVSG